VESCTALVEHHDGSLELLRWTEQQEVLSAQWALPVTTPAAAMAKAG
jgi:hypothetical protein